MTLFNATGTKVNDKSATCWNDIYNTTTGRCDNAADVGTYFQAEEAYANLLASMSFVETRLGTAIGAQRGYWPDTPAGWCAPASTAGAALGDHFCVDDGANNHIVAHEMGHNARMGALGATWQQFVTDATCGSNFWSGAETSEKCATNEGYAHFVGASVWWNQNAVGPHYRSMEIEGDTDEGNTGSLQCVLQAGSAHRTRGNVARFFWDVYDSTLVGAQDSTYDFRITTFADIHAVWTTFYPGTAQHQSLESGAHGRNIEDYVFWAPWTVTGIRDVNCLSTQVD